MSFRPGAQRLGKQGEHGHPHHVVADEAEDTDGADQEKTARGCHLDGLPVAGGLPRRAPVTQDGLQKNHIVVRQRWRVGRFEQDTIGM